MHDYSWMRTANPKRPATQTTYYDYDKQCWIVDGKVAPCGHPDSMKPTCCYAGQHAGEKA